MHVVRGLAVIGVAMAAAVVAAPQLASAHARYKSSAPGKSEVVQQAPAQVEITFTEEIQKIAGSYSMTVTDSKDAIASTGPAVINEQDRSKMSVALPDTLPPGRYVVHYSNVSDADGDPFDGAFAFYVATQPTAADQAADAALAAAEAPEATDTAAPGGATSTKAPSTSAASPAVAATPASGSGDGGSNTGLFVGIAVAVVVVVVLAGGGYLYLQGRRR
ncbi:MAG: copper resistance protein CopC [Dehalococcoidia bacterium]|nr:MAG: copper resistance protein CopC [Dehalococcoidia bacterium]